MTQYPEQWSVVRLALVIIALLAFSLLAFRASADEAGGEWDVHAMIYAWLPSIDGETLFEGDDEPVDVGRVIESIDAVFMGGIELDRDDWGFLSDYIYIDLSDSTNGVRPGSPLQSSYSAELGVTGWSWTAAGTYALIDTSGHKLKLVGGFRYLDLEEEYRIVLSGGDRVDAQRVVSRNLKVKDGFLDAVLGLRGRAMIAGTGWYVPYYLDVGTGDSDFTWQLLSGIGYSFDQLDFSLTYRHLEWEFASDTVLQSLSFYGPMLGVGYRW